MKIIIILAVLIMVLLLPQESVFANATLVETEYAWLWGYGDIQIPEYLTENFDRIFKELAEFFGVDVDDKKILVWLVPFNKLQQLYNSETVKVPAFYDRKWNRIYLTPWHVNEYFVTLGIVSYFMDEYPQRAVSPDEDPSTIARCLILKRLAKELEDET